jgi:hypothetical protein
MCQPRVLQQDRQTSQDECENPHLEHHPGQHPIREGQRPLVLQNAPHRLPHPDLDRALRQVLRHDAGLHHVHRGRHNARHEARNLQEQEGGESQQRRRSLFWRFHQKSYKNTRGGGVSKGGDLSLGAFTRRNTYATYTRIFSRPWESLQRLLQGPQSARDRWKLVSRCKNLCRAFIASYAVTPTRYSEVSQR